jgi:hypothetical protein
MTNSELNQAIKRLYTAILEQYTKLDQDHVNFNLYITQVAAPEFHRLYGADTTLGTLSKKSLLIMVHLNRTYRFMPFHTFGINIQL